MTENRNTDEIEGDDNGRAFHRRPPQVQSRPAAYGINRIVWLAINHNPAQTHQMVVVAVDQHPISKEYSYKLRYKGDQNWTIYAESGEERWVNEDDLDDAGRYVIENEI